MSLKNIFGLLFIILFLGFLSFSIQNSFSSESSCLYQSQIDQCLSTDSPRSITDFVCIKSDDREEVIYQIILDEKFKEVDEKMNAYLTELEENKSQYFGSQRQESHLEGIDDIVRTFSEGGEFQKEFLQMCGTHGIISEAIACSDTQSTSIQNAKDFFKSKDGDCMRLANIKLKIAQEVAFDILNLNKHAVRKDEFKLYGQEQRTKYDELLNNMMINQGYMMKILQKTPSMTKNTYGN